MSSEVKGIWFVSLRGYVERTSGPDAWLEFCEHFTDGTRPLVRDALPSEWYPERLLQEQLGLMHGVLSGGDDGAFLRLVEDVSVSGIGRFFRILVGLGSPRFAVKQTPTLWRRLRRGPSSGYVTVTAGPRDAVLEVRGFSFLRDRNYRLTQVGTLRGLLQVVRAERRSVEVEDAGDDWMRIRMVYG